MQICSSFPSDIPTFEYTVSNIQERYSPPTGLQKWEVTTSFTLKYSSTIYLNRMTLFHTESQTLIYQNISNNFLQLQYGYMLLTSMIMHNTFIFQVQKTEAT